MRHLNPAATLCNYNVINLPWNQFLFNISFSLVFLVKLLSWYAQTINMILSKLYSNIDQLKKVKPLFRLASRKTCQYYITLLLCLVTVNSGQERNK